MLICKQCGQENPEDNRYCRYCAAALTFDCPHCGRSTPVSGTTCQECGFAFPDEPTSAWLPAGGRSGHAPARRPPAAPTETPPNALPGLSAFMPPKLSDKIQAATAKVMGQRREVTALVLNVRYVDQPAQTAGEEQAFFMANRLTELLAEVVYEYEGHIDQDFQDNITVLFGAPVAHENDPERAIRVALALQQRLRRLQDQTEAEDGGRLEFRIGVHTGKVIVGAVGLAGQMTYSVIGNTVSLATTLAETASQGTILIGESTYQLTAPLVDFDHVSELQIEGGPDAIAAYQPIGLRQKPGRLRGLPGMQVAMIGREHALSQMQDSLADVCAGPEAGVVLVSGEAGVGKSRLILEFRNAVEHAGQYAGLTVIEGKCQSHLHSRPYWVVAEVIRAMVGVTDDTPLETQFTRLVSYLNNLNLRRDDIVVAMSYLLGLNQAAPTIEAHLRLFDATMLQKQVHSALRYLLLTAARSNPLVLVFEDLHWVDSASWEFLLYFVRSNIDVPLLLVLSSRSPMNDIAAHSALRCTEIELESLSSEQSRLLVDQLIRQSTPEAEAVKAKIAHRAAGNPFYTEEIIRILIEEQGIVVDGDELRVTGRADQLLGEVPGTLQAVIMARFDKLDSSLQRLLQKAATLGLSFAGSILHALDGNPAAVVNERLWELVSRQFLDADGNGQLPGDFFHFRHVLVQEAIYKTLLRRDSQQLHGQAAQAIEKSQEWPQANRQEILAYHYTQSDTPAKAIPLLMTMAESAAGRYANETALHYYRLALDLIEQQGGTRSDAFFRVRMGLGRSLKFLGSYEEARNILAETLQAMLSWSLAARPVDVLTIMVSGLREMGDIAVREGDFETAVSHLEAGITALGENGSEAFPYLYQALMERVAFARFRQGKLDEAHDLAQIGIASALSQSTQDPVTLANLYNTLGGISWQQGNIEVAIQYVEKSLKLYEDLSYTWGTANALSNLGILYLQLGNWHKATEHWERALHLRQEIGDVQNQAISLSNLGLQQLFMGNHEAAQQYMEQGLALQQSLGDHFGVARANTNLARLALTRREWDEALRRANLALTRADEIGAHEVQIEARWVTALLHAHDGDPHTGLEAANSALQMSKTIGLMDGEADCLRVIGTLHQQTGEYVAAETHFHESIELSRQMNDPYRQGLALLELGRLYQALGNYGSPAQTGWHDRARQTADKALAIFETLGAGHDLQLSRNLLHELEVAMRRAESQPSEAFPPPAAGDLTGERKVAAVLWMNVSPPAGADEERIFELTAATLPACATIAREYDGYVRQRTDGLTVVFGIPSTFEDDTIRAVQAANHILDYLRDASEADSLANLVQLVVTQGTVVAGQAGQVPSQEFIVRGQPLDQAQQTAAMVPTGRVWVTGPVRKAGERLFAFDGDPYPAAAGLPVWELTGLKPEPEPARGLPGLHARFIGRDTSLEAMVNLAKNLSQQIGGVVLIEGEAGIGKSRLMREFQAVYQDSHSLIWSGRCSAQRSGHAFSLFSDLLSQVFNFQPTDASDHIRHRIDQVMRGWPADLRATQPYLEVLAGIQPQGLANERLGRLEPEQLRQQIFVAVRRLLKTLAAEQPLVIMLDDLHWIDPISAELLLFIVTTISSDPILFVCAQRREGSDSPNDRLLRLQSLLPGQTCHLYLDRLSPELSRTLLDNLLPGAVLPEQLTATVIERSEGNPYFIEEFIRMLIEQEHVKKLPYGWQVASHVKLDELTIPSSLETLLRSRVDALPEDLKVPLQCASVVGTEFEVALIPTVTGQRDAQLALERLVRRLMLRPASEPERLQFSHALLQSVVYNSMLAAQRRALHRRVAEALEARWSDSTPSHAKELSYHYARAADYAKSVPYLILAGEQAAGQYAEEEALEHFEEAATLITKLDQPDPDWQWRIAVGLGDVYRFVGQYERSMEVLSQVDLAGDLLAPERKAALHRRLGETAQKQGDFELARTHFETALGFLGEPDTTQLQSEAARTLQQIAWGYFAQGRLEEALEASQQSLGYAQTADGLNELATVENLLGGIYLNLGEWRNAFHHTTRAMVLREQMGYSWGVAGTLSNLGILAFIVGHWAKAINFLERSLALRQEMGDVEGIAVTQNNLGWVYRNQGKMAQAEPFFRASLETATTFNIGYHIANSATGLAHAILGQGRLGEAQEVLNLALSKAEEIGVKDVEAEARRVLAELLLARSQPAAALEAAQQGAVIAAEIGHPSYEAAAWRIASVAALQLDDLVAAEELITKAGAALAGATDDLEAGHVAAQAYRLYHRLGQADQARASLLAAKEIFSRLGANLFLTDLEQEALSAA
jgi:predicted ATPase/class 3 adenylate cyclase